MGGPLWLRTVCRKNGVTIADDQLRLFQVYVRLLLEWNQKINLISRRDEDNIWQNHILHSIAPLFKVRIPENTRILDLGTGGGLPGIPIKILNPTVQVTMMDSTQKKISALSEIIRTMGLHGASAVWGRAEELAAKEEYRKIFAVVVARGVGSLNDLVRLAYPFLRVAGESQRAESKELSVPCLLAYKGGNLEEEIEKGRRVKFVKQIETLALSGDGMDPSAEKKLVIVTF